MDSAQLDEDIPRMEWTEQTHRRSMRGQAPPVRWFLIVWLPILAALPGCAGVTARPYAVLDRESVELESARSASASEALRFLQAGRQIERSHPAAAISFYREAALAALPELSRDEVATETGFSDPGSARQTYRRAIEYAVLTADREAKSEGVGWADILARGGIDVRGEVGVCPGRRWTAAEPTRMFKVSGLRRHVVQDGVGAPLCLSRRLPPDSPSPEKHFPRILYASAASILRPGDAPGDPPAVLELHDPIEHPSTAWAPSPGEEPIPLAYDLSTPLARQFQDTKLSLVGPLTVLFPSSFDRRGGIYMIDPYDPRKIPVVFVHGLMSSPLAWSNAMNDLRGDPELRERYQFWMFFYSTGNSIAKSAARLRASLTEVQEDFDPARDNPNFNKTVLIGHSMGGLLSRAAVSSSGDAVWKAIFNVPPEKLDVDPEHLDEITRLTHFEPLPMVNRVVFVSTPHRGSPLGDEFIGRISSSLIRIPSSVSELRDVIQKNQTYSKIKPEFLKNRQLTSIAQLGEHSPVIAIINKLKISGDVPYHSIIGYNGEEPLPGGGDGVVPYSSAHIEGALSELVVSSDHSAQETQPGIAEMRRILKLHLAEYDAAIDAVERGVDPVARITRPSGRTPVRFALTPPDAVARSAPTPVETAVR